MQKRIILALGISSIVGLIAAQEVPAENLAVTIEQAESSVPPQEKAAGDQPVPIELQPVVDVQNQNQSQPIQVSNLNSDSATQPQPPQVSAQSVQPEAKAEFQEPVATPVAQSTAAPEEHAEDLEIKGIDTVNVAEPKGNWLYKRIWWEKAERTYEKIKELAEKIQEARIIYFARRTDLDRNVLDPFYLGQGFSQGELTEVINFLSGNLEQERKDGTLDEKELALLNALTEEKNSLENLQKGVKAVTNIDHALDDALLKLSEQLNQARLYEQQAWDSFKAINRELSDKRARELYYGMDTYWRNLNNINTYISDSYSQYFDQLTDRVKQEIDKIKNTMDALKEKGIDIQLQAQKLKGGKPAESEEEAAPTAPESTGVLGTLWSWMKAPFAAIGNMFGGLFGLFSGSGSAPEELSLARPERSKTE